MSQEIERILKRGVAEVIIEEDLRRMLENGRPLRLKEGFDPSRPDIHLGHVVGLRKLRQLQDLGHLVILIVGDWTAQIGDPSGQSQMRTMLSAEEVKENAETYMKQFFKVVDPDKTEVRWQSEWFGNFTLADVIKLTSKFTVAQMLAREDFSKRYQSGSPIGITELLYPLLQAYDSVMIESDVEFGGIDQKFNCLLGRELQEMVGQKPQQVFFTPLLVGTDGSMKMSKSLNNYISVDDPPGEMYGKVMSLPDTLIMDYFELLTDVPDEDLSEFRNQLEKDSVNPMDLKKRLAREIVTDFHDEQSAGDAEENFRKTIQEKQVPDDIPTAYVSFDELLKISGDVQVEAQRDGDLDNFAEHIGGKGIIGGDKIQTIMIDVLLPKLGLVSSRNEAKRLLNQKAVKIDGKTVTEPRGDIKNGSVIKVGKRRYARIMNSDDK
ncbi:MAG: tyrosine--tRNA ligase [Dehalococcoidia bacterium]